MEDHAPSRLSLPHQSLFLCSITLIPSHNTSRAQLARRLRVTAVAATLLVRQCEAKRREDRHVVVAPTGRQS